jgi:hypothetical protein
MTRSNRQSRDFDLSEKRLAGSQAQAFGQV